MYIEDVQEQNSTKFTHHNFATQLYVTESYSLQQLCSEKLLTRQRPT